MNAARPHILLIVGSPRTQGNSSQLARIAARKALEKGFSVSIASPCRQNKELFFASFKSNEGQVKVDAAVTQAKNETLKELKGRVSANSALLNFYNYSDARPCLACMDCSDAGDCIFDDAIGEIFQIALTADAILWLSPIYFASIPSQLKKLIDRTQALYFRRKLGLAKKKNERKPSWLVLVGGGGDPFGHSAAIPPVASASRMMEAELQEELVLIGPDEIGDIDLPEFESFKEAAENFFDMSLEATLASRERLAQLRDEQ